MVNTLHTLTRNPKENLKMPIANMLNAKWCFQGQMYFISFAAFLHVLPRNVQEKNQYICWSVYINNSRPMLEKDSLRDTALKSFFEWLIFGSRATGVEKIRTLKQVELCLSFIWRVQKFKRYQITGERQRKYKVEALNRTRTAADGTGSSFKYTWGSHQT